jgi:hypothetical protein
VLTFTSRQLETIADAFAGQPIIAMCAAETTWIGIELVDDEQNPVPRERYRLRLPDFSERQGLLDDLGQTRVAGIMAGTCQVCFPDIDAGEWFAA